MAVPTRFNTPRPLAWGYRARLNDLLVRLLDVDDESFIIQTVDTDERQLRVVENPEDMSQSTGMLFSRSDFSGGEGLAFAHRPTDDQLDHTRFWASDGIDVVDRPGKLPAITLLPKFELTKDLSADPPSTLQAAAEVFDGRLFVAWNDLHVSADGAAWSTEDPSAGEADTEVYDVAALGGYLYAAMGDGGVHRRSAGSTTWEHWSDLEATKLWAVKDRLFGVVGNQLYEVKVGTDSDLVMALPGDDDRWNDLADAGRDLVAAASNGYLYFFTFDDALNLVAAAQTKMPEEIPVSVVSIHDQLLFGTSQRSESGGRVGRLWRATLAPTVSTFTAARVVAEWEPTGTDDYSPHVLHVTRGAVYTGIRESGGARLWRYDLEHDARVRHLNPNVDAPVWALCSFQGKLVAVAAPWGVYVEQDEYVDSGWLIGPAGDMATAEAKIWSAGRVEATDFGDGGKVELAYTTDIKALHDQSSSSWRALISRTGYTGSDEASMPNVEGRFIAGKLTLHANGPGTAAPTVSSFSFRAYPSQPDVMVRLPVLVSDRLELPGRRRTTARGLGLATYQELVKLENGFVELELLETSELLRGRVRQVTHVMEVTDRRGRTQRVSYVTFQGRRATFASTATTSDQLLGIGRMGLVVMGGREE